MKRRLTANVGFFFEFLFGRDHGCASGRAFGFIFFYFILFLLMAKNKKRIPPQSLTQALRI